MGGVYTDDQKAAIASGYSPNLVGEDDLTAWDLIGFIGASTIRLLYGGLSLPVPKVHAPLVYVVSSLDLIKIGYTTHLYTRLAVLQSTTGQGITLEAVAPGTRQVERQFHVRFAHERVRGEWFRHSEALGKLISAMRQELPFL